MSALYQFNPNTEDVNMLTRCIALLAPALLMISCGQQSQGLAESRQYALAQESGANDAELCAKAQQVADAYLQEENREEYSRWRTIQNGRCRGADITQRSIESTERAIEDLNRATRDFSGQ